MEEQNKLKDISTPEIEQVLSIIDNMIAGKRFGEVDTNKQMYFLNCQARINDMQRGEFDLTDIEFLKNTTNSLIKMLNKAKEQLENIANTQ